MRLLIACACALTSVANIAHSAPQPAAGSESLGGQLLDDLPGSTPAPKRGTKSEARDNGTLDHRTSILDSSGSPDPEIGFHPLRFDDVGAQDGAQPSGPLLLMRAGQTMVQAETLLRKEATIAQAGEAQQQVVVHLDQLIAELSKQCNCSGGKPSDRPPSPSQRSQAKPGKSGSKPGGSNAPARDSNDQLNATANQAAGQSQRDLQQIVKHLWGHLPEREREQMMQSFSDEFLPKYEREIEQYYQRLSEESATPSQ
jgi:hypothetical protein